MGLAKALFWGAAFLLAHAYLLYPLALFALDGVDQVLRTLRFMREGADRRRLADGRYLPPVSLVVAVGDEAERIGEKLANSLAIDYPADRFQVLIGSGGSTGGTDEVVRACGDARVQLLSAASSGKAAVLNRCIPAARGEIVVLSEPGARIDPAAVRKLVRHFEEPEVGAVCGKVELRGPGRRGGGERAYRAYESLIKLYEGKQGAVMGASGGLYAIRRSLFTALPPSVLADDFLIPLRILENGYQVRYEAEAVAHEEAAGDHRRGLGRRARIAAGGFHALRMVPGLLAPTAGFRAFALWSHKVLRWAAPGLMAVAFAANWFLLRSPLYVAALAGQLLFYGLACFGGAEWLRGRARQAAGVARYVVATNLAIAVGFWRFLRGPAPQGP